MIDGEEKKCLEEFGGCKCIGDIPIRNLWLLMLYASDLFREKGQLNVTVDDIPDDVPDLVAEILCRRVEDRLLRSLSCGYEVQHRILSRVRGRINQLETVRKRLLERGKIACSFQDLTVNTSRNRYVKTALEKIGPLLNSSTRKIRCRHLAVQLRQMGVEEAKPSEFRGLIPSFGYYDRLDRQMVEAARLVFEMSFPTQTSGSRLLAEPDRKIQWLRRLYENAVGGFYKTVLSANEWKISTSRQFKWNIDEKSPHIADIFPSMRTDIVLEHLLTSHRIVIDTKFNSLLSAGWYREESIRSGYVYQIYAYLRSQERKGDQMANTATGILLHPSVHGNIDEFVRIQNHKIRFVTVDLASSAQEIRKRLLDIIQSEV